MAPTRRTFLIRLSALLVLGLPLAGCSTAPPIWPAGKSPKVLASFPPLYCFTVNLVGDEAAVISLLTTTGPHDYHITSLDPIKVKGADMFVVNGLSLDDAFTSRLKNSSGNLKLNYVELGKAVPPDRRRKLSEAERKHEHDGHVHSHGTHDPHVWLGIPEAIQMVERLRDELKAADKQGRAADYDKRAEAYVAKLKKLHKDGKDMLAHVKEADRKLITMHESMYYFARSFDLTIVGSIQPRAGVELDAVHLKTLVDYCKNQTVPVITVEPQYPENAARTLRDEVARHKGANVPKLVELDPLETADPTDLDADWYETKMRQNLKNLADALR